MKDNTIQFTIDFNKDVSEIDLVEIEIRKDGCYQKKVISYDTLAKILIGSSIDRHVFNASIPNNSYSIYETNGGYGCIFLVKGKKRPLLFERANKRLTYIVPYPNLLFDTRASENGYVSCRIFAVKDEILTEDTVLYQFPYSNVSDSGHVCFGTNEIIFSEPKEMKTDCERMVDIFFSSPYNGDYYAEKYTSWLEPDMRKLFEKLSSREQFPNEILISKGTTVKDLLNV